MSEEDKVVVRLMFRGGQARPGPRTSQLGPLGVPIGKVVQEINKLTKEYEGMKVPVEIVVDPKTRQREVRLGKIPTSVLILKKLGLKKGAHNPRHEVIGNLSIRDVIEIAKQKLPDLNTDDLKAAVKTILGTMLSMGVNCENKDPKECIKEIDEGKYDDVFKEFEE